MSPAVEAQKIAPAKPGKLVGKEFEETFKPKGRDKTAKELEDKTGKDDKKEKKKKPKLLLILIIVMVVVVLLGGTGAALYFTGKLNPSKIFNDTLNAIGLQLIASATENPSASPVTSEAPGAEVSASPHISEAPDSSITPEKPSVTGSNETTAPSEAPAASPSGTPVSTQTFQELQAEFSDEKLADLKHVGTIYSKMDPAAAAEILARVYDTQQIAIIIYNMQPAASALLMAKLDPTLAAQVTELLTS